MAKSLPKRVEKLPSGSYRIRVMVNGRRVSRTLDYRPTAADVKRIEFEMRSEKPVEKGRQTFQNAAETYCEDRSNVLSPSTIRGYVSDLNMIPDSFKRMTLQVITSAHVQAAINQIAETHAPHTTKNCYFFIRTVLRHARPDLQLNVLLPQPEEQDIVVPENDSVRQILKHAEGTKYYIPLSLACYGLRRGEICALTLDDVGDGVVSVTKSLVQGADRKWYVKLPKTRKSTRIVPVSKTLTDLIHDTGTIYEGSPGEINKWLKAAEVKLGLPNYSLHKLRHYFASQCADMRVPDPIIMQMGGWSTDRVMKRIYTHAQKESFAKHADAMSKHMDTLMAP